MLGFTALGRLALGQYVEASARALILPVTAGSFTATGQSAGLLFAHKAAVIAGAYTATGNDTSFSLVVPVGAATYTATGQTVQFAKGLSVVVTRATYTMAGLPASFAFSVQVAPGAYSVAPSGIALIRGPLRKVRAFQRVGSTSRMASVRAGSAPRGRATGSYGH